MMRRVLVIVRYNWILTVATVANRLVELSLVELSLVEFSLV